ncbi:MAG: glutamate-5-semialdehyde dehydrogenase [Candidatus Auribacterota bacterium]|nr:glutamate-5-semialdehyde dehydrogenase [Candidatus Auribacterota bacterium]
MMDYKKYVLELAESGKSASRGMASAGREEKNRALLEMAELLEKSREEIEDANRKDLEAGEKSGLNSAMLDRLRITPERLRGMANGLRDVAALDDPVGKVIAERVRPNGLVISRVRDPIGVIGIIYESRPNVTVDAAGLCLKSGNAVILRGGKEAINSNLVLAHILRRVLESTALPVDALQIVNITDRAVVGDLLKMDQYIDLIIPRGGESLIRTVVEGSTIPVIKHYQGICHIYVAAEADLKMALEIVDNAKTQRPGVCNAVETVLVDEKIAERFLPVLRELLEKKGVELRGCERTISILPGIKAAVEEDWGTEYLDLILSVRVVSGVNAAIDHINTYGSRHSDAIITGNEADAELFTRRVDSAAVYVNASNRFTDGGEFGLGAEIGISTDKLHARGPMGLEELTTYKYVIRGEGQIRV